MNLSLTTGTVEGQHVLDVAGEVDVHSSPALRERLQSCLHLDRPSLILDLTGVDFIDSTGLGVLVAAQSRAAQLGGTMRFVCTQERVLKLFRITGLDRVFVIFASRAEALAAGAS